MNMYKGKVIKLKSSYGIVMSDTFQMERIRPKPGLKLGQEIYYFDEDLVTSNGFTIQPAFKAALAMVVMLLVTLVAVLTLTQPVSMDQQVFAIITMDINPSIEIQVNKDKEVIDIIALNDDAKGIINDEMIGQAFKDVMKQVVSNAKEEGYLLEDGEILVTKTFVDEAYIVEEKMLSDSESEDSSLEETEDEDENSKTPSQLDESITSVDFQEKYGFVVEFNEDLDHFFLEEADHYNFLFLKGTTDKDYKAAKSSGLSLGKYMVYTLLIDTITMEEIKSMKVAEIAERKDFKDIAKDTVDDESLDVIDVKAAKSQGVGNGLDKQNESTLDETQEDVAPGNSGAAKDKKTEEVRDDTETDDTTDDVDTPADSEEVEEKIPPGQDKDKTNNGQGKGLDKDTQDTVEEDGTSYIQPLDDSSDLDMSDTTLETDRPDTDTTTDIDSGTDEDDKIKDNNKDKEKVTGQDKKQ